MADVRLVITADTNNYVRNVKQAQKAQEDFHKTVKTNTQREKGLIEDIEESLAGLREARRKAFNVEDIEKYNRKIKEAERDLQEYNQAGLKAQKTTESFSSSISKWVLSLGGAAMILGKLKEAFLQTVQGMNLFNNVAAVTKQALNDIVSGTGLSIANMRTALLAQQQLNNLRLKDYKVNLQISKYNREFQEQYAKSVDQTLSDTEKLAAIDGALASHAKMVKIQLENIKEEIDIYKGLVEANPTNEKYIQQLFALLGQYEETKAQAAAETKRLFSRQTGIKKETEQKELEERKKMIDAWHKEIEEDNKKALEIQQKFQDLSLKLLDDYDKSVIDSLEGAEKLKAQREYDLKQIAAFKKQLEALGKLSDIQEEQFQVLVGNINKAFADAMVKYTKLTPDQKTAISEALVGSIDLPGLQKSFIKTTTPTDPYAEFSFWKLLGIDEESDEGKEQIAAFEESADKIKGIIDDLYQKRVEDATRNRELLDQQILELQNSIQTEAILTRDGYASNVSLKKQELAQLQKERDAALRQEEKTIQRQKQLEAISQTVSLMSSAANLIKQLTSKGGVVGLVLAVGAIASLYALWANAKTKASESTRLAEGGSGDDKGIIKGKRHFQGGERFRDNIEVEDGEAWGVLNRRATKQFGPVFHEMISSFNRGELPEIASPSVNVVMDTKGTNKRLDAVKGELVKANSKKEIAFTGDKKIIRNGNSVRIVYK